MMNRLTFFVEQFFSRFSYSGKIKFICALGIFYAVFLTVEIFMTQYGVINMFRVKSAGLKQHQELSLLLEDTLNFELLLSKNTKGKKNRANEAGRLAESIENRLKTLEGEISIDNSNFPALKKTGEENFLIDKTLKQWGNIDFAREKDQKIPVEAFIEFSKDILNLMDQNMKIHSLNLGVDMPIFLLSEITMSGIPRTLTIIANIAMLSLQSKAEMTEPKTQLLFSELLSLLQSKINTMKTQIEYIGIENHLIENQKHGFGAILTLNEYETIVRDYIQYLKDPSKGFTVSQSISQNTLKEGLRIQNFLINFLDMEVKEASHVLYRRQRFSFLIILIGLLSFFAMYVTRMIRRPLEDLKDAAIALADGDLSARVFVTSKDEVAMISQAFNEMAEMWERSLIKTKMVTLKLVEASVSIFEVVNHLEANDAKQEACLELMGIQVKEIGTTTQKFNEVLREVNKSIASSSSFAEIGRYNLTEMEMITQQMNEASRLIVDTLALIGAQVEKIKGVLGNVVTIADQSNLLSLNTAIRASQIGEKGAGFSVVAGKIRELADRTAFATLDIEAIIQNIVNTVSIAVVNVEKFSFNIIEQVSEEKRIGEHLSTRIDQTQEQIKTFDKIQGDMDTQFKESLQMISLINELIQVSTETGKLARQLKLDAEFLYRGTKNLQAVIDRWHYR